MISSVSIFNFKSFKEKLIEVAPLTVLTGLNGSGKSSFIQSLLFLRRYSTVENESVVADLNEEPLELGHQKDIQYCYDKNFEKIIFSVRSDGYNENYACVLDLNDGESDSVNVRRFVGRYSLEQSVPDPPNRLVEYLHKIQYVSALRTGPSVEYRFSYSRAQDRLWGKNGDNAFAYFVDKRDVLPVDPKMWRAGCDSPILREQVNAWMRVISPGVSIFGQHSSRDHVMMAFSFDEGRVGSMKFQPQNVGFGISYVLPLVVMLLSAQRGDCLVIENPEAHIHPKGQAELGVLLAQVASAGVQIFVETHSDHLINGIRVAVKQKSEVINHKDVIINFFERKPPEDKNVPFELYTDVTRIDVRKSGELSEYPDGFMDEWDNRLEALLG